MIFPEFQTCSTCGYTAIISHEPPLLALNRAFGQIRAALHKIKALMLSRLRTLKSLYSVHSEQNVYQPLITWK